MMNGHDANPEALKQAVKVAYWPDGFWLFDLEKAQLCDRAGVFGEAHHKVVNVPEGVDVGVFIKTLCAGSEGVGDVPCAQGLKAVTQGSGHTGSGIPCAQGSPT